MASSTDLIEGEKITLVWVIENFSHYPCKPNEYIRSPKFFMKNRMTACWRLSIYPKGTSDTNDLSCTVHLEDSEGNEKDCKFDSNISIALGKCSLNVADWTVRGIKRLDINISELVNKRTDDDTLTVYCDIWNANTEPVRTILSRARTVISKETSCSICRIKDFSLRQPNEVYNYHVYFASQNLPLFVMSVSLVGVYTLSGGRYQIQIKKWKRRNQSVLNENPVFVSSRISLLDKDQKVSDFVTGEFLFDAIEEEQACSLPYFITKKQLTANRSVYLPDDILSLLCEVSFSSGVLSEQVEFSSYHIPKNLGSEEAFLTVPREGRAETTSEEIKGKFEVKEELCTEVFRHGKVA